MDKKAFVRVHTFAVLLWNCRSVITGRQ